MKNKTLMLIFVPIITVLLALTITFGIKCKKLVETCNDQALWIDILDEEVNYWYEVAHE